MSNSYQVNLHILSGMDFFQEFLLTDADFTPMDLTGLTFHGTIQKHSNAVDVTSVSQSRVYVKFDTEVVDASTGVYTIKLPRNKSILLEEGKYVYDITAIDDEGKMSPANSGLVFVNNGFGFVEEDDTDTDTDTDPGPDPPSPPGSGGDDGGSGSLP